MGFEGMENIYHDSCLTGIPDNYFCKPTKHGVKHDNDKIDWSYLLKDLAEEVEEVIRVMMFGAKKYGRDNWHMVLLEDEYNNRYPNASIRHIVAYNKAIRDGEEINDHESGYKSLAHAVASLLFQMSKERLKK